MIKLVINGTNEMFVLSGNNRYPTDPLKLLLASIASCVGKGIQAYIKTKQTACPFEKLGFTLSNSKIRITCKCELNFREDFVNIVNNCQVSNWLIIGKVITFV